MARESGNLATTHPGLLKWLASSSPFWVVVKTLPLLLLFAYFLVTKWSASLLWFALAGLVSWSFYEYATHRWLYHTHFKNKHFRWFIEACHLHHHRDLSDKRVLNAGVLLIYPLAIFFWGIAWLLTQSVPSASAFGLGMLLYYIWYEHVHFLIHERSFERGYLWRMQRYHLYHHHKAWHKNYGNTTTFWDRVFGTFDREYLVDDTEN